MQRLAIHHSTIYRYARPVEFGEHRMMLRPRDSHDLRLIDARMTLSPPAEVRWMHDVFGNSIALARFSQAADHLEIDSDIQVEHYGFHSTEFEVSPEGEYYPFAYSEADRTDLGATLARHYPDEDGTVTEWARGFLDVAGQTETRKLLVGMTSGIKSSLAYEARDAPGTQPPAETLTRGAGTCRDYALLMMEGVRSLGLAARFVTGYLYDPMLDGGPSGVIGAGATHAWVQVFLPGTGWIEFDPTNGIVGGANLIRVGVARDPGQAIPIDGSFTGATNDFLSLEVSVEVKAIDASAAVSAAQPGCAA